MVLDLVHEMGANCACGCKRLNPCQPAPPGQLPLSLHTAQDIHHIRVLILLLELFGSKIDAVS